MRKLLEVMTVSITLTLVMVSLVCAYVQMHHILCIKYVYFFELQLYPLKLLKKPETNSVMEKIPQYLKIRIQKRNLEDIRQSIR